MPDILSIILYIIIGIGLGSFVTYLFIKHKLKNIIQKNSLQEQENNLISKENQRLKDEQLKLQTQITNIKEEFTNTLQQKENLATQLSDIKQLTGIEETKLNFIKEQQDIYNAEYKKLKDNQEERFEELTNQQDKLFEIHSEKLSEQAEKWRQEATDEYAKTLEESVNDYIQKTSEMNTNIEQLTASLDSLRRAYAAAVEAHKREAEKQAAADFYRLVLSNEDKEEIAKLRTILPYLRNAEPLNKVIYKCYYEKPYTDLIGRVVGSEVRTGIYKITNINDAKSYVGQAVNIAERWKQHIKRGLGAETPTQNKLYPAMLAEGVENFTFEIIEDCRRDELDAREDYWQDFYKVKEWGYSIK